MQRQAAALRSPGSYPRRSASLIQQILQPEARDAADLLQAGDDLLVPLVAQALLDPSDDIAPRQPAHRHHERKIEAGPVGRVQRLQARELLGSAGVETGAALLAARCVRQLAGDGEAAGKLRVGADERELLFA